MSAPWKLLIVLCGIASLVGCCCERSGRRFGPGYSACVEGDLWDPVVPDGPGYRQRRHRDRGECPHCRGRQRGRVNPRNDALWYGTPGMPDCCCDPMPCCPGMVSDGWGYGQPMQPAPCDTCGPQGGYGEFMQGIPPTYAPGPAPMPGNGPNGTALAPGEYYYPANPGSYPSAPEPPPEPHSSQMAAPPPLQPALYVPQSF